MEIDLNRIEYLISEHEYGLLYKFDTADSVEDSKMHYHNNIFEILYFIKGNCCYMVEGRRYMLSPGDMIISRPNEIHKAIHQSPKSDYERILIEVPGSFFVHNHCEQLKAVFTNRKAGMYNLIMAASLAKRNIPSILSDLIRYCNEDEDTNERDIIMNSKLIELLYNLNRAVPSHGDKAFTSDKLQSIIVYINENLSSNLSLDFLTQHFYISKGYLCHLFKEQTGMTINKYITHKRLLMVQELYSHGYTLLNACGEAGFNDYSTFHRMYVKEFGTTPKKGIRL